MVDNPDVEMVDETDMDPISCSVIGSTKSVLHVPQPDGTVDIKVQAGTEFSDVLLNVSTPEKKELYEIWEEAYRQKVENYTTKNGDNVTVEKNDLIDKLPAILTI